MDDFARRSQIQCITNTASDWPQFHIAQNISHTFSTKQEQHTILTGTRTLNKTKLSEME